MRSGSLSLSKALLQLSVRWNLLFLLLLLLCLIACTRSLLVASALSSSRLLFFSHGLLLLFVVIIDVFITFRCRRLSKGVAISVLRQHGILIIFNLKLLFLLGLFLADFSSLGLDPLLALQADSIDAVGLNEVSIATRQELLLLLFLLLLPIVIRGVDHDLLGRRLVMVVSLSHGMFIQKALEAGEHGLFGLLGDEARVRQDWHQAHQIDCLVRAEHMLREVLDRLRVGTLIDGFRDRVCSQPVRVVHVEDDRRLVKLDKASCQGQPGQVAWVDRGFTA